MCCIFTCCGWMLDLFQRCWVFVMSCCISSAVCMSVMTASFSGIAMGYNYSLAEYIDLKETNVSVFLKRGIFDDDLSDSSGGGGAFGRRAGQPLSGLQDSDLVTGDAEELVVTQASRRRLDDSVFQSRDNSNFESSLLRLTVKPPAETEAPLTYGDNEDVAEVFKKYPAGSLDQLKAIQSLMNMRKNNLRRVTIDYDKTPTFDPRQISIQGRRRNEQPELLSPKNIYIDKAAIPYEHINRPKQNPIRTAVPMFGEIGASENWLLPKDLEETMGRTLFFTDEYINDPGYIISHSYPQPIRYNTDVMRPTVTAKLATQQTPAMVGLNEIPKGVMDSRRFDNSGVQVKEKLLMDKSMFPSFKKSDASKSDNQDKDRSDEADYEEEAKQGIRVRKKRNIAMSTEGVVEEETHYSLPNLLLNKYLNVENDRKINKIRVSGESKTTSNFNTSVNVTNNIERGNVTQHPISVIPVENESDVKDNALHSSIKGKIKEMSTIDLNKFNYSLPTAISVKSHNSVLSFIKSLLN